MASSSYSSCIKRYHVFPSFHGPDVRRTFLSHLRYQFATKGITTFKDQEIERGHTIGPELVKAIRESRVSVVLLSKNYASSGWCLDELVEILKCREDHGHLVMTIFYDVDPSSVRKQRGDFGSAFQKTCQGRTEEKKQIWSKALTDVANIEGEHSLNWTDEAMMVEKFATDVSNKLNVTLSRDFDDMVGLQAHLRKVISLLCFECDEVKMIGIWGPAGIGKSTIARALFNHLSSDFGLRCFVGNLKGSYVKSIIGVDDYDSKLGLQSQLLSKILNQRDMRVYHLGAIKERLHDQRVLIILDDVDDVEKLEVLAKEPSWFGLGSRIIVTTEDKNILKAHDGIQDIYHVDFPSRKEALEMLCLSAFKESSPPEGFEEVANKVAALCGNLPLGLCVVGSSLRGESKQEWELQLSRIRTNLDRKIEDVLRVGYDRLSKKDQALFLHIACFFKKPLDDTVEHVRSMLADSNLDVENGLKTLAVKSLVQIEKGYWTAWNKWITMHSLIRQLGRQIVNEQSDEPGKRQFLVDAEEIREVLANETGTGSVISISLNMDKMNKLSISGRAFEGMRNLRFLRIYGRYMSKDVTLEMSEEMEYLPRLRLLYWSSYPGKRLPPKFQPECLVELRMPESNLEKLWGAIQPLANLKAIDLSCSYKLNEIPNLSKATNLETLRLDGCARLVELPSSISNLHKLERLEMGSCVKLRVIPTNINLASLEYVDMSYCSQLRTFPDISSNISHIDVSNTKIEHVPASVDGRWSRLELLEMGSRSLKKLTHVPLSLARLDLSNSDIKKIPNCVIGLPGLKILVVKNCRELVSLQGIPRSLLDLYAADCASLKSVSFLASVFYEQKTYITLNNCKCVKSEDDAIRVSSFLDNPTRRFRFQNCLKLDEETRREIIQRWAYKYVCLPGKQIPAEFTHRTTGNSVTILGTFSASSIFKACLLLSPSKKPFPHPEIVCRLRSKGVLINEFVFLSNVLSKRTKYSRGWISQSSLLTEHLFVFSGALFEEYRYPDAEATTSDILFEFSCNCDKGIIECGVQMLAEIKISSSFDDPNREVKFLNCLSLDEEARRAIIQRWAYKYVCLPGKQIPAEFTHRATGSSVTISEGTLSASSSFKACVLLCAPNPEYPPVFGFGIVCRLRSKGVLINELKFCGRFIPSQPQLLTEHLFVFPGALFKEHRCFEVDATTSEIQFDFEIVLDSYIKDDEIIKVCGVQILAEEGESSKWKKHNDREIQVSKDESIVKSSKHTGWWSWLKKLGPSKKEKKINKTERNSWGVSISHETMCPSQLCH